MLVAEKLTNNDTIEYRKTQNQVNKRKIAQQKRKVKMAFTGAIILLLILGNLAIHALVIRQDYFIKTWNQRIAEKEQEILTLRMEIAELESFDRIQQVAQNELGMTQTKAKDLYVIQSEELPENQRFSSNRDVRQVNEENDVWGRINDWLGGFGKTMAKD
ncbi:MAG TPA: hypothetical protein PLZ08_03405 [Bacillota bacterium]|nr:hypothetical protein [Bacillota bacterium]HOL08532.1 hypothetical protein [Bacillota bacterium]HPO96987.1 hypothetical protein [Bacillota bacterium]